MPDTARRTPYHDSVDDLRRELVGEASRLRERADRHRDHSASEAVRDAWSASVLGAGYAYTLAAVLGQAGVEFGPDVQHRLACLAEEILTNGDPAACNADVGGGT